MTLSNEDIFYIRGVHKIIMDYKEDMDIILKKIEKKRQERIEQRNWIASIKHINRMNKARRHIHCYEY